MSTSQPHDIACPFCRHEQTVELWDAIHVDSEPELRQALLYNRINRIECAHCQKSFRIDKPLVYQDKASNLLIYLDPPVSGRSLADAEAAFQEAMDEMANLLPADIAPIETHLVVDWSELIERVFLTEEGLDARLIEHVKYMMHQQNPDRLPADRKRLLFNAQDSTDEQLCFVVQDLESKKFEAVLNFARADYEALVNVFDSGDQLALLTEQFPGPYLNGRVQYLRDQNEMELE